MNPHRNSNPNPATAPAVQQVNPVNNQQMCNGNVGGLYPNNRPIVAPTSFMNFPNQAIPLQNAVCQFPNGMGGFNPQQNFTPFPVNQFNPSQQQPQQQQGQFFANNPMNPAAYNQNVGLPNEQVIVQNAIQNLCQLIQLQNPGFAQCPPGNFPMFPNQIQNQNQGFLANQQFGMPNPNGPVQQLPNMGQQLQGNSFIPNATFTNYQNQMGPQNPTFLTNQQFNMANSNGPMQHINQGQPRFVSPMMDANALKQIPNMGDQGNSVLPPTFKKPEDNNGNMPANVNGGWGDSHRKNFTGNNRNDASHKGFKSQFHHAKHGKDKFGNYNGNMNRAEGNYNAAVASGPRNSTKSEKRVPSVTYTDQDIKQWREARKNHFPTKANVEKKCKKEQTLSEEDMLRRQQLKEILKQQAILGCEVADIPSTYLSDSDRQVRKGKKHEREPRFRKGKFRNKRGRRFQDDGTTKKPKGRGRDSFKSNEREPSLLKKLLSRDIKREKNHLLQVFRFIAVNSFFMGDVEKSLRFPSVIVKEMNADVAEETPTTTSVIKRSDKAIEMVDDVEKEEEGEITD